MYLPPSWLMMTPSDNSNIFTVISCITLKQKSRVWRGENVFMFKIINVKHLYILKCRNELLIYHKLICSNKTHAIFYIDWMCRIQIFPSDVTIMDDTLFLVNVGCTRLSIWQNRCIWVSCLSCQFYIWKYEQDMHQGAVSIRKTVLPGMAIPMLKIRRPNGRLIFNMEITIRR